MIEKNWQAHGLTCVVVALEMGHRCGYVGVNKSHKLYASPYQNLDDINVHGGLTYSENDNGNYPLPNNNLWFFGFDCAHYMDGKDYTIMSENYKKSFQNSYIGNTGGEIRTLEFCIAECESLAKQLSEQ